MTEDEIMQACADIAALAKGKELVRVMVSALLESDFTVRVQVCHFEAGDRFSGPSYIFGERSADAVAAFSDTRAKVEALPSEKDRNTRAAVEALEAARAACLKIDADDVAASLTAAVARLSEDLLEHKA